MPSRWTMDSRRLRGHARAYLASSTAEERSYAVVVHLLLIGLGDGRHQNATALQEGEGSVLRLAADRVEDYINAGQYLLEPRRLNVNDVMGTECLDVRDIT